MKTGFSRATTDHLERYIAEGWYGVLFSFVGEWRFRGSVLQVPGASSAGT
jgi:hypothetical protein